MAPVGSMFRVGVHGYDFCSLVLYPRNKICGCGKDFSAWEKSRPKNAALGGVSRLSCVRNFLTTDSKSRRRCCLYRQGFRIYTKSNYARGCGILYICTYSVENSTNSRRVGYGYRLSSSGFRSSPSGSA